MTYQDQQDAIKNKVSGAANDVADRASDMYDKASRQAGQAKKQVVDTASDYAHRAAETLNDYGVDTDTLGKALTTSADSIGKSLRGLVRDRPLGALAVTAAIGLIIGAMTSR
jgi:ElaB/YqjD/DUF883 family membrane-anchored ribosome-binding protein